MKKNIYNLIFFICFRIYLEYKYKISIIIPVYKGEKFIKDCVETLINQTLTNIQIIFIDDESPDNSSNIIKEYAKNDERIILKYIKHASISDTRNEGLKYVEGEYIGFVDDDDFIDLNQYEKMYNLAKKDDVDLLEFHYRKIKENVTFNDVKNYKIRYTDTKLITKIDGEILEKLKNENWNKIYKADIIQKNNIRFFPNIGAEDLNFNLKVYPFIKSLKRSRIRSYYYRYKEKAIYDPIKYFFGNYKLYLDNLVEYYKKINLTENNPNLCLELMIISYKNLFWNTTYFFNKKFIANFFFAMKKLNIDKNSFQKITKKLKHFYFNIFYFHFFKEKVFIKNVELPFYLIFFLRFINANIKYLYNGY
jgi:glycosyltransferase involved in cell wall biosynthesis